jgi:hypothetical protein
MSKLPDASHHVILPAIFATFMFAKLSSRRCHHGMGFPLTVVAVFSFIGNYVNYMASKEE